MTTVRVIENNDLYFVGDLGLAYEQAESFGFERGFAKTAAAAQERFSIDRQKTELFVRVEPAELYRAICDVAMASWQIADTFAGRADEQAVVELSETVIERLERVFGKESVDPEPEIMGHSHISWPVTAIVHAGRKPIVFQAVGKHAQSIYRANTAFHDISILEDAPQLVSVVKDKEELGDKISLLSQASRVVTADAADDTFLRLVA